MSGQTPSACPERSRKGCPGERSPLVCAAFHQSVILSDAALSQSENAASRRTPCLCSLPPARQGILSSASVTLGIAAGSNNLQALVIPRSEATRNLLSLNVPEKHFPPPCSALRHCERVGMTRLRQCLRFLRRTAEVGRLRISNRCPALVIPRSAATRNLLFFNIQKSRSLPRPQRFAPANGSE